MEVILNCLNKEMRKTVLEIDQITLSFQRICDHAQSNRMGTSKETITATPFLCTLLILNKRTTNSLIGQVNMFLAN